MESLEERVIAALRALPLRVARLDATRSDMGRLVVVLESPDFAGKQEHERQSLVWNAVLDALPVEEYGRVEFIHTDEPGDAEAA